MENITNSFSEVYIPFKALLMYRQTGADEERQDDLYVESYDIGKRGQPINAHPLTEKEMLHLSLLLKQATDRQTSFTKAKGILPNRVLHINTDESGQVIWYTPAQKVGLFFGNSLGIVNGLASVPSLIWKAGKDSLFIYAYKGERKPSEATQLYHAPFFNLYSNGGVCMGTVNLDIQKCTCLEDFISTWEHYFWNSYFSHLIGEFNPVNGNILQLWQELISTGKPFPSDVLKKTNLKLENLI